MEWGVIWGMQRSTVLLGMRRWRGLCPTFEHTQSLQTPPQVSDLHRHFIDDITIPSKMGKGTLKRVGARSGLVLAHPHGFCVAATRPEPRQMARTQPATGT